MMHDAWVRSDQRYNSKHMIVVPLQVLMWAQLRGNSQSLVKVVSGGLPRDADEHLPAIVHDTSLSARIDGGNSFGMLAMKLAVDTAVQKAREGGGMAIIGTTNTASGTGALGWAPCTN